MGQHGVLITGPSGVGKGTLIKMLLPTAPLGEGFAGQGVGIECRSFW